jgi:hypothetical protein
MTGRLLVLGLLFVAASACARGRPALPSGAGTPFPGFEAAYADAVNECRSARTVVAELGLSGRAGGTKLRGRINAGFAVPSAIRLEGIAFGRPIFILASRDGHATLLLVREDRIVRDAPPEAIVEALAGVSLTPAELRAAVAGCGLGAGTAANGRMFGDDWAAVDAAGGVTYLRRVKGRWRVGGASRGPLRIVYAGFSAGLPGSIHVRSGSGATPQDPLVADITLRVSQLEINTAIDRKAFEIQVPRDAAPLSIDELRKSGPLGERGSGEGQTPPTSKLPTPNSKLQRAEPWGQSGV